MKIQYNYVPQRLPFLLLILLFLVACSTDQTQEATVAPTDTAVAEVESITPEDTPVSEVTATATAVPVEAVDDEVEADSENADDDGVSAETTTDITRPDGWAEASHSNDVDPNYAVVFPQDKVNRFTVTIDSADWQAMIDNLTELLGEPTGETGGIGQGGQRPAGGGAGGQRPAGGEGAPAGAGQDDNLNFTSENPVYVPATIEFEGDTWTNVGVRFKGNSTLKNAWNSGSLELPFKFDFDEYEDQYPEIDNQRFYGFKQLSLSNPASDASYVRAALSYDILQDEGLVAPETAWYEMYVDYGEGPISFGVYTVVEVIDDSVIKTALGDDDGNIYEGDGTASSFAEGTREELASGYQKENNDDVGYDDLEALYDVLHAETRLTDADQWRADLEAIFDVDTFLHWLATNTVIVNWDTYGTMTHNYYLYHDLDTELLTWIGWDYNEAIQVGKRGNTTLSQETTTDEWPLIRYLLDQPEYYDRYVNFVAEVDAGSFNSELIDAKLQTRQMLLSPFVADSANFQSQLDSISAFVEERHSVVATFLAENNQ